MHTRLNALAVCAVFCSPLFAGCGDVTGDDTTGSIQVTTSTTGQDLDVDGYICRLDASQDRSIGITATEVMTDLAIGEHSVELSGVAENCTVSGDNPRTIMILRAGHAASTTFSVTCSATTGSLEVTAVTVGDTLDPDGYVVEHYSESGVLLDLETTPINGTVTFSGLEPGDHSVALSSVAKNCVVSGDNPRNATIIVAQTAQVSFGISCAAALFDHIAFISRRDGDNEVYVMHADGSNPRNLTNNPANDWGGLAWSPDGTRIAFATGRDGGNTEVYVMDADGSNLRNLTNNAALDYFPAWSPDGTRFAFGTGRDRNLEIYVMNADGSDPRNLTNNGAQEYDAAWSPDGTRIALTSDRDGNYEVYVIDADGSNAINLTNHAAADGDPAWSPDGTKISFTSDRDGNMEVYVMDSDGSNPTRLTNNSAFDGMTDWSPDGTEIAFQSFRNGNGEVYVMYADGSNPRNLTNSSGSDGTPAWSPQR